ncbi:MAG: hypothetical protein HN377_11505 [Alphaproteobacteria bacterium]|jgi:hypothetical protein|nr:hypothetical protein [Alphaproteobacteria bacterium]MBT7942176.1 hypothetical protein [Alphaproteobacteria bacterium]
MLKDWLFGKIQTRALDTSTREVQKFVTALKNMGDKDLGTIVAVATVLRVNFETHNVLALDVFGDSDLPSSETLGRYQLEINRLSRQFRKMGLASDAAAAMVWSYTLRCLNVPELRPLGLEMWAELQRGFPHVEEALLIGEEKKDEKFPDRVWAEWAMVPVGFESSLENL